MRDAVEQDLNRYLGEIEREDAYQGALEDRSAALFAKGGDYYPFTAINVPEALGEIATGLGTKEIFTPIAEAYAAGDHKKAGELIGALIHDYWAKQADRQAEHELDTECQRCWGRGCLKCDPPDRDDF